MTHKHTVVVFRPKRRFFLLGGETWSAGFALSLRAFRLCRLVLRWSRKLPVRNDFSHTSHSFSLQLYALFAFFFAAFVKLRTRFIALARSEPVVSISRAANFLVSFAVSILILSDAVRNLNFVWQQPGKSVLMGSEPDLLARGNLMVRFDKFHTVFTQHGGFGNMP